LVLSKPDLLRHLASGRLRSDPEIAPEQIAQVSIDLRLGRKFSSFRERGYLPAIHVDPSLWDSQDLWRHEECDVFRLEPGQLVLAQTLERVHIPSDVVGLLEGRSSFARVGVTIHVTAPKIDPGFDATITLEMANFGRVAVDLRAGIDRPAQLMLLRLTTPLEDADLYGASPSDVFQGQTEPLPRRRPPGER
jgi:dCTP deaminase